jgi:hypothetical protein
MPVAVTLRLDAESLQQIEGMIEGLPDRYIRRRPTRICLATYGDDVDFGGLDKALGETIETWRKLSITLVGIAVDPGDLCGLSLLPIPIHKLLEWHIAVDDALYEVAGDQCFERGIWSPNLTLGRTAYPSDAIDALTALWQGPIEASLNRIDLVRLDPWKVLSSHILPD